MNDAIEGSSSTTRTVWACDVATYSVIDPVVAIQRGQDDIAIHVAFREFEPDHVSGNRIGQPDGAAVQPADDGAVEVEVDLADARLHREGAVVVAAQCEAHRRNGKGDREPADSDETPHRRA